MKLEEELRSKSRCEVHFDPISRQAYSVDASIYEIEPLGIVVPKNLNDLIEAVKIARDHLIPIIPRGAATGIAGGCLGSGLIFDLSKYFTKIHEINLEQEYVICEPGVIQDDLNRALLPFGYRLGPDTSTGNRATLGGMLANNAAGSHSLRYGQMVDHVLELDLLLATGELVTLDSHAPQSTKAQELRESALHIKEKYFEEIKKRFSPLPRRVSGYNLDTLLKPGAPNLASLVVGSEGTLGIVTRMKLRICKKPLHLALCVLHFDDLLPALKTLPELLTYHPLALEMIDRIILEQGRRAPAMAGKLEWLEGDPAVLFVAEFEGPTQDEAVARAQLFAFEMRNRQIGYAQQLIVDESKMDHVWDVRKAGLGLLLSRRTYTRAVAFIEDLSIAPTALPSFFEQFLPLLKKYHKEAGIYGHVGAGCMHIRPYMDFRSPEDLALMQTLMEEVSNLILAVGGALSGEHGDGRIRSWLNRKMFGEPLYQAFHELKEAFDPAYLMNPGKIIEGPPVDTDLRLSPQTEIRTIDTFLDFSREGGFALSADLCNGNGQCRKKEGVLCPSFQASGDEYDTTRARAQALRAVINSRVPLEDLYSPGMLDVLDLCIQCKGCKRECPSQVDMAKMKTEVLFQTYEKKGIPWRSRLFGSLATFFKWSSPLSTWVNGFVSSRVGKSLLGWMGIAKERTLPSLAKVRFSEGFKSSTVKKGPQVVLFNDTYTEFCTPEIGHAAVKVLEALGFQVVVLPWQCCGRPQISKGLLRQARDTAEELLQVYLPWAEKGIPIVGLEPSCILTLRDELRDFKLGPEVETLAEMSFTFDEFVARQMKGGKLPLILDIQPRPVKVHGHCYQKALSSTRWTLQILRSIPGYTVEELDTGCCGMAGSFGYEKEHAEFSLKIAELKLFPAIRNTTEKTLLIADGLSCRSQIAYGTDRRALHLAEALAELIRQ